MLCLLYHVGMNSFDSLTLKAFLVENESFLTGARIQKIQQPTRREFVLTVRKAGVGKKLYISINPQIYHICFMSAKNEEKRRITIPQKPPMFCMLLRKHLENSKISKVAQPQNERIFEIYVDTYNELGEVINLCLAVELMGKHSNVILYNTDTNVILGCAHNVGDEKSRVREVSGTLPYTYPPKQNKLDILNYNGGIDYETLDKDFHLFSRQFAKLCKGVPLNILQSYARLENVVPGISDDFEKFSLYENLIPGAIIQKSVNSMIDNYFTHHREIIMFKSLQTRLLSLVRQRIKRTKSALDKMDTQISSEQNADEYRVLGDMIMANLYANEDYRESITAFDYENNQERTIELDPTKTLKENANNFYKLYTKSKKSLNKLKTLHENLLGTKIYLEQIEYSLTAALTYEELLEVKPELAETPQKSGKQTAKSSNEPKKLIIDENTTIYIGKNNRQNDYIVSKLAKDGDLWFHTRDCAGSHVLLKSQNPDDELIFRCATLAKTHSAASKSSKVGVIYTEARHLKKPPGANLGYVTYKSEREIIVD